METNNESQTQEILTQAQFRALHLWFEQTAKEMRDNGITMTAVLSRFVLEVPTTKESIKEMWKILQESLTGKKSTKELLKKEEIDQIYMALVKFFAEQFELELPPFPSYENTQEYLKSLE